MKAPALTTREQAQIGCGKSGKIDLRFMGAGLMVSGSDVCFGGQKDREIGKNGFGFEKGPPTPLFQRLDNMT